jgi:outer membrane protein OmpA-like peptidoglycan-associated protein
VHVGAKIEEYICCTLFPSLFAVYMPLVRSLFFFLSIALLSSTVLAKSGTDPIRETAMAPFVKKRAPVEFKRYSPPQQPQEERQTLIRKLPQSISARNYYGFELGLTAATLAAGTANFIFPYPYDNLGRGDSQKVGPFNNHSISLRYSLGGTIDYAINEKLSLQGKLSYRVLGASGEKETRFGCFALATQRFDSATFNESYEMDLRYLGIDMLSRFSLVKDGLYGLAGFGLSTMLSSEVDAIETINSPNDCQYTYSSGPLTHQYVSQSLDMDASEDLVGGRFDLRFGIGTFIPLGSNGMMLVPELTFGIPLHSVIDPVTTDRTGIRSTDLPIHPYASLTVGLKFPWSMSDDATASKDDKEVLGYLEIRKGSTLAGRVLDQDGRPINDASIVVVDLGSNTIVVTDTTRAGNYSVQINEPGRYSVTADADGYLFGSTLFEVDNDGYILIESKDLKLSKFSDGRVRLLVFFESNKAVLQPSSYPELNHAAEFMRAHPSMLVEIAGYTDSKGSDEHNKELSQRRADAVKDYIIGQGVEAFRLTAIGYGEMNPISNNETEAGRAENRRVEFVVKRK